MRKEKIGIRIDELTGSLKDASSGEIYPTDFRRATGRDIAKAKNWLFDWRREFAHSKVYKLFLRGLTGEIQGLVSLRDSGDHIWINLVEAAPHNLGKAKSYIGVGGNLFAIAVKISFDKGYQGFVAFEAKTELISHYKKVLGATQVGRSPRMVIDSEAARKLYAQYFVN